MKSESATRSGNNERQARFFCVWLSFALIAAASQAQTFQNLYDFTGPLTGWGDGALPEGALIHGKDGNFYGTTMYGGACFNWSNYLGGLGCVFKMTSEGTLTILASFCDTNGAYPYGGLVQASDGNLYGTTLAGWGSAGSVFKLNPAGQLTTLGWFGGGVAGLAGAGPLGDLVEGPDGKLYGVTEGGGDYNSHGTIFRISTNGTPENLYFFYGEDGLFPSGGLLLASDGNFYGVTGSGGAEGKGTVFRITTNGTFAALASFHGGLGDASWPNGRLVEALDGSFYGASDGSDHVGAIFRVTRGGILTTVANFDGANGERPVGPLALGHDGVYGSCYRGGIPGDWYGTVFRLDRSGRLTRIVSFTGYGGEYPGRYPYAGLVRGNDGNLYGTTAYGGSYGAGTIFRIIMPGNECRLDCPTNIIVCSDPGQCGAVVHFGPAITTNCAGYAITANPLSGSFFPVGTNTVTWTMGESASGRLTDTCNFQVIVRDCEAPKIRTVAASPYALWPPNHKMQSVTLHVSATDNCHSPRSKIVSVTINEPLSLPPIGGGQDEGKSRAGSASDWEITGDLTLNLRAERSGKGTGRVYTITVECTDDFANTSTAVTHVTVLR